MGELTILGALNNAANGKALTPVAGGRGWHRIIREPYAGAFQQNMEEKRDTLFCYPTLYACLASPSQDIGKLPFQLMQPTPDGNFVEVENPAYSPVLRRPNRYQNPQQFREAWILSLLTHGNTYVLKLRDQRNVVIEMYILDPCRVMPMVSEAGEVYYQINYPSAQNLLPKNYPAEQLTIPASEIMHDRINCFHHQLIGIPPVCAAYWAALKNLKILKSSAEFFGNHAQPGGILTGPTGMSETDAETIKQYWATNYGGQNSGKIAVIGADMKFTSFAMKSADSQLVEQMKYSDEQICQPFRIKPYKIGIGNPPGGWKSDDVNVEYHSDALSPMIESMESLLMEGLDVAEPLQIWLDTEPLWRMDEGKTADIQTKLIQGMVKTPDEGRRKFNLSGKPGGDTLWGQHQDYPLGVLAERGAVDGESVDGVQEIQGEALNGAQVTALQGIIISVASGELDPSTARGMIEAAFPLVTQDQLDAMIGPYEDERQADQQVERGLRAITALNTMKAIEAARNEAFNERI